MSLHIRDLVWNGSQVPKLINEQLRRKIAINISRQLRGGSRIWKGGALFEDESFVPLIISVL